MKLDVINLSKHYTLNGHDVPVLRDFNANFHSGETVAITGRSGVGKSTLLHLLGTLDAPSGGQIQFDGEDWFKLSQANLAIQRNSQIGFVFQFHHLLPELTAIENVAMPLLVRRVDKNDALRAAEKILGDVGLAARLQHRPGELSGGEQQRVALARALVGKPRLVLADEPTGNLDDNTGAHIVDVLTAYAQANQALLIVITHHQGVASRMQRVLELPLSR